MAEKKKEEGTTEENKNEIVKTTKKGLKTLTDQYIDNLTRESEKILDLMGLKMSPEVKSSLFGLCLACDKAIKEKGIEWKQIDLNGLASNLLNYARLEFNPANNEIYLIPYKSGTKKLENGEEVDCYQINFEESYLGKKQKAIRFSDIKDAIAFLVREDDVYEPEINFIEGDIITFHPKPFNTGKVIGAVCYLRYEDNTKNRVVEMTVEDLEKVKQASKDKMGGKISPAWRNWESEMQKKAVLKRGLKDVEIKVPSEFQDAYFETEKLDNSNYDLNFEDRKTVIINKSDAIEAEFDEKTGETKVTENPAKQEEIELHKTDDEVTNDSDYVEFE